MSHVFIGHFVQLSSSVRKASQEVSRILTQFILIIFNALSQHSQSLQTSMRLRWIALVVARQRTCINLQNVQ